MRKLHIVFVGLLSFVLSFGTVFAAGFTVTIDAGHGGKDPGAIGSFAKEKNINLAVALRVGKIIESRYPDVRVVYTRKTDVFIPLEERAAIANNAHSNLFLCIHTNSSPSPAASGSETYTLGLAKTQANMNVARRENAVILLEDNYKQRYQGFNPNSTDSYIMFEYMQDKYIDRSVQFASDIQTQFAQKASRSDRGVRQAGFWVLHRTAMPAVLVEVGYVSNKNEEEFISSEAGQERLAESIVAAFGKFKHENDRRSGKLQVAADREDTVSAARLDRPAKQDSTRQESEDKRTTKKKKKKNTQQVVEEAPKQEIIPAQKEAQETVGADALVFKVQFFTSPTKVRKNSSKLKGVKDVDFYQEKGAYKYTTAESEDYNQVVNSFKQLLKTFPDAFIVAFKGGQKVPLQDAIKQWKKQKK
ncbi:N-acetylmuramoyl-L-alanine amidase [Paludibacter sp.]|uniref:N-acetylmuramoyl-L-alanine amidase family protein n=1 Tax=Paludibacter sp. TaxID=1898105 RepID=UPI0013535D79|nr:N-acetylmuramoyl-L-alanine amidase [Paludibacter sp.]MTK52927.1 N-acetylmuramoyl-L-alanine amidase [Paludibacter sp.]